MPSGCVQRAATTNDKSNKSGAKQRLALRQWVDLLVGTQKEKKWGKGLGDAGTTATANTVTV